MSSHEHHVTPQLTPIQEPVKACLGVLEQELLEGNFDWSRIQPSVELLQIRKDVMRHLQAGNPEWDETRIAQTTARIETAWKVARYEQQSQTYGESDERVIQLQDDINFWRAVLGSPASKPDR